MGKWMRNWNATTKTCHADELWANCFMREAGFPETDQGGKIGCGQVGPNTCPEPTWDRGELGSVSVEMGYGAHSIYCEYFSFSHFYPFSSSLYIPTM